MQPIMQGISAPKAQQSPLSSDLQLTSLSQVQDSAPEGINGKSCITIALLLLTTNIVVAFLATSLPDFSWINKSDLKTQIKFGVQTETDVRIQVSDSPTTSPVEPHFNPTMDPTSFPTKTIIAQPSVPAGKSIWTSSQILKDFDRIHKSPKHLKLTFVVGLEGSGHHFWHTIFGNLAKLSQNETQNGQIVVAGKELKYCLNICFTTSYWGDSMTKKSKKWLDKKRVRIWRKYDDLCDCVIDQLKQYADTLQDGALLALGYPNSYPFGGLLPEKFPDLELLISMAQSPKLAPYIFDVRLIAMKRDVATCLVSACAHRFGHCETRIKYAELGLSLIQTQLMGIDPQFWIMLDYDHLVTHLDDEEYTHLYDSGYVDIFAKWLSVKPVFAEMASSQLTPSKTTLLQTQWDELQNYNKTFKNLTKIIKRVFYADEVMGKWPIFNDPYFCVSPENTVFLDSKLDLDFTIQDLTAVAI